MFIYNDLFAGYYDEELQFENQDEFFHDNPEVDIRTHSIPARTCGTGGTPPSHK